CPGPPVRRRDGKRDARAERGGEPVPLEGTEGADSAGGAPDPLLPQGASAGLSAPSGLRALRLHAALMAHEALRLRHADVLVEVGRDQIENRKNRLPHSIGGPP